MRKQFWKWIAFLGRDASLTRPDGSASRPCLKKKFRVLMDFQVHGFEGTKAFPLLAQIMCAA